MSSKYKIRVFDDEGKIEKEFNVLTLANCVTAWIDKLKNQEGKLCDVYNTSINRVAYKARYHKGDYMEMERKLRLEQDKEEAVEIARDLGYSKDIISNIWKAGTSSEVTRAMITGRKAG